MEENSHPLQGLAQADVPGQDIAVNSNKLHKPGGNMKSKIYHKKLNLNKKTIATLERQESNAVYGGADGCSTEESVVECNPSIVYPPTKDPSQVPHVCCF